MMFFKNTLFARISQMLILLVMMILLFSFLLFQNIKLAYDKMFYQKFRETISLAVTFIENELDKISEMTLYLSTDEVLQLQLRGHLGSDDYIRSLTRETVQDLLFKQAYGESYISLIELHLVSGDVISIGRGSGDFPSSYSPSIKENDDYLDGRDYFITDQEGHLVNVRNIRNTASLDFYTMGTMLVYSDVERLIERFRRNIPYYSELNLAVIKDGVLLTDEELSSRILEDVQGKDEGFYLIRADEKTYFVTMVSGKREGWLYMGYVSMESVDKLSRQIWAGLILSHLLIGLILIIAGRSYLKRFTSPLENLSHRLKAFELDDFTISLNPPSASTEEIDDLYRDVDIALKKIQNQVFEDYMKQMSLQKTQLQMLQSQINPHFLYNTLDSISWMAKSSGEAEMSQMVVSLGRLLRHSLSEKRARISLKDELDLLGDYLAIQKIRFQEKLNYVERIHVDPKQVWVLPFLLQPMLENSIKYGIEEGKGHLDVVLEILQEKDSRIRITFEDNGSGFPRHILEKFKEGCKISEGEETLSGLGVGLANICHRLQLLKLYYKRKAEFHISNRAEGGARVTIMIPQEEKGEDKL